MVSQCEHRLEICMENVSDKPYHPSSANDGHVRSNSLESSETPIANDHATIAIRNRYVCAALAFGLVARGRRRSRKSKYWVKLLCEISGPNRYGNVNLGLAEQSSRNAENTASLADDITDGPH